MTSARDTTATNAHRPGDPTTTESPTHAQAPQPQTQQAPPSQEQTAATTQTPLSVAEAAKAERAAYLAWSASPPDPDLLDAFVAARQQLRQAEAAATPDPARAVGGPLVLTPVIEWWTT